MHNSSVQRIQGREPAGPGIGLGNCSSDPGLGWGLDPGLGWGLDPGLGWGLQQIQGERRAASADSGFGRNLFKLTWGWGQWSTGSKVRLGTAPVSVGLGRRLLERIQGQAESNTWAEGKVLSS